MSHGQVDGIPPSSFRRWPLRSSLLVQCPWSRGQ